MTCTRNIILTLSFTAALSGCATPKPPSVAEVESKHLAFLEKSETTREDVLTKLGTPSGVFENERILTYRLRLDPTHGFTNSAYAFFHYGLTVVFDDNGRLKNFKLRKQ
jgi:outer membrane protein assembly factor BamE (lipoprotein component of BamABCDE complex)